MKKALSILMALTMVVTSTFVGKLPKAEAAQNQGNTARYENTYDVGRKLRQLEKDEEFRAEMDAKIREMGKSFNFNEEEANNEQGEGADTNNAVITKWFMGLDATKSFPDSYYFKKYTLRSVGENCEVWVANDLSYPEGDARPAHVVTQEEADLLRDQFDNNIYQKDTEFFGKPGSLTGENATLPGMVGLPQDYYAPFDGVERVMILVDNVRDEIYHNPEYPIFIAGFFSPRYKEYFNRNIITIDSVNVEALLSTVAHEFQHLIHNSNDSKEELWIDEGMATYAETLCGYGIPEGDIEELLTHPENSLVEWDEHENAPTGPETLADYGQAYLFTTYLNDQYGKELVRALALNQKQGIESVNEVLADFGIDLTFEDIFRNFVIALAIDSPEPGNGIYNFESLDLNINYESAKKFDKDGVPAWGADYKVLDDVKKIRNVLFDGIEFLPQPWQVINDPFENRGEVFWGNEGNHLNNSLIFKADLTGAENPTLKFDTFIHIEPEWDAGMVQVSTDNGETWTSLANENTIGQEDFPFNEQAEDLYNNLPGFSATNTEWTTEEFDLSAYAGQNILVNFRYMTDGAYNDLGWFIDNIEISEVGFNNDCSSLEGFYTLDQIKGNTVDYAVTFINEKQNGNSPTRYQVVNIDPFNIKETDKVQLEGFFNNGTNYMIVWYAAPVGKKGAIEFTYEIMTQDEFAKNKKFNNGNKGNGKKKGKNK
ncbi:peptidase MA family metallohydrolase [Oceanirhabdus sp. W0125-5]|uniref:peptidase MA family metallohydrolase n=1 Tax=Oceanirhabdus sp. W0125-5 TaxID=2999116 RepID=UPI0022F34440|nr:choice-of-anchor J domain-containing protein [Oceanirhabdus sp. W0125-5]WBW97119.1 immune inhibitor A [Oceanirhabdus sp. W0125-5]